MSPTLSTKQTLLTVAALREIARQEGPGITLLIPEHHPGAPETTRSAMVRGLARSAAEQAAARQMDSTELLQPIEDCATPSKFDAGGPGIVLFRSPTFFETHTVPGIKQGRAAFGRNFQLSSLIVPASVPVAAILRF